MKIRVLTLFPKMFECMNESIIGRAIKKGVLDFAAVDIREYTADSHGNATIRRTAAAREW